MVDEIFLKILLSLGLGALVGIEREQRGRGELAQGIRTFMLASFLGFLSTHFSFLLQSFLPFYISFVFAGILTALAYFRKTRTRHLGQTTNFAFLITFLLGTLIYFDNFPFYLSISLAILLTFILASKEILHTFSRHLTKKEVWNAVFFAVLSFVILPILPNKTIDPLNSINPFLIWSSVVTVLSLSFIAYILMKIFGTRKGIIISGILGGIISSVAVAISMANEVKKNKRIFHSAIFSILAASSTMFLRVFFISSIFNSDLSFRVFTPLIILSILGYFFAVGLIEKVKREKSKLVLRSPLELKPALRFGMFFMLTMILISISKNYFGEMVVYPLAFITGLADVDAIVISLSSIAFTSISPSVAAKGIILAAISNTISKWFLILWLGTKKMALETGKMFLPLVFIGIAILFFI